MAVSKVITTTVFVAEVLAVENVKVGMGYFGNIRLVVKAQLTQYLELSQHLKMVLNL